MSYIMKDCSAFCIAFISLKLLLSKILWFSHFWGEPNYWSVEFHPRNSNSWTFLNFSILLFFLLYLYLILKDCNAGDLGLIPGLGRSPGEGNGNPLQYSCLENPVDRGAWRATVHGVAKSRTRLSDFTFTFFHFWRIAYSVTASNQYPVIV